MFDDGRVHKLNQCVIDGYPQDAKPNQTTSHSLVDKSGPAHVIWMNYRDLTNCLKPLTQLVTLILPQPATESHLCWSRPSWPSNAKFFVSDFTSDSPHFPLSSLSSYQHSPPTLRPPFLFGRNFIIQFLHTL